MTARTIEQLLGVKKLLASNRAPDSYVAGATVINRFDSSGVTALGMFRCPSVASHIPDPSFGEPLACPPWLVRSHVMRSSLATQRSSTRWE